MLPCPLNLRTVFNVVTEHFLRNCHLKLLCREGGGTAEQERMTIFTDHPFHHVHCVCVILALKIYENSHTWTALVRRITTQRVTDVTQRQQPLIITKNRNIFLLQ